MSLTAATTAPQATVPSRPRPARVRVATRTELIKLVNQLPVQLLAAAVIVAPIAFAGLLSSQSGTPSDALAGNWAHTSGYALSLVLLSFAGNWGGPIIAGVLAGDLFASEDRHRTWPTILGRETRLSELFLGKLVAVGLLSLALGLLLALASVLGGLVFVGGAGLPNFSGAPISGSHVLVLTLVSWLSTLPALLGFTAVAVLASVLSRNAIVGVLAPVLVGLVDQLLTLTGNGVSLHLLLLSSGFTAWTGIFVSHPFYGPLIVAELAALVWVAVSVAVAWRSLSRREFVPAAPATREGRSGRIARTVPALRIVAAGVVVLAVLALATAIGPTGVTRTRVTASLAASFKSLTIDQQNELGHPIPAGSKYSILPLCNKRGARPVGPGDWDCTVNVYVLLPHGQQPLTDTPVDYDVSVDSDGCYKADAPAIVVGGATIRHAGRTAVNPLSIIYGCFDVL